MQSAKETSTTGYRTTEKWMARQAASAALHYGLAFASVAAALALARTFLYFHLPQPFAAFALSAIAITFWYGGTKPGILAAVLASVVRSYLFEPGLGTLSRGLYDLVFLIFALLMTVVTRARDELEVRVAERTAELTRANEDLKREIAERKQAEYLIGQVFETSPDGIAILGRDYRFQRVNPAYEHDWGIPAKKIVGMHAADLLGLEMFEKVKSNLERCFVGEDVSYADWFPNVLGRRRYRAITYSPLRPVAKQVEAVLLIARDFTEHMLASEALRQTQADLAHVNRVSTMGELTASLAHEVNQPIAAAITDANTCLRWLTRDHPDVEEAREAASRTVKDANRAAEIVSRVRLLFKGGAPQHEPVDINELIREMIVLLRSETTRYSVSVFSDLAAYLPPVMGDRVQLQQVLMNLMINAVDAMKTMVTHRDLTVKSRRIENEELMVSVSDTGVGLPPQQADQIFNAFFTTKSHGTGMGLRISRSIVESHGGRLWAADNPPRGASFHLTLPTRVEPHE
jgi:PAS domain S-box-containing protein